jgi:uncharacterized protein DUF1493
VLFGHGVYSERLYSTIASATAADIFDRLWTLEEWVGIVGATDTDTAEPELIVMVRRMTDIRKPILRSTAIYHDLRIAGDDAYELFEMVATRFGTSFEGFDWPKYFPNETQIGPLWRLAEKLGHDETKWRRLTVGHLLAVIQRGVWFEPEDSN